MCEAIQTGCGNSQYVCGFILASTGLLSEKTCSTHWAFSETFREFFPDVDLQTDKLITDENGIYTNGVLILF